MPETPLTGAGMPLVSPSKSVPSQPGRGVQAVRVTALALGATALFAVVCLVLMFVVGGSFGTVNDYANAAVGWLTLVLAAVVRRAEGAEGAGWAADLAVVAVVAAAVGMTWGTYLVVTGSTGYYLAGLVSTLGIAAVGAWLLLAHAA